MGAGRSSESAPDGRVRRGGRRRKNDEDAAAEDAAADVEEPYEEGEEMMAGVPPIEDDDDEHGSSRLGGTAGGQDFDVEDGDYDHEDMIEMYADDVIDEEGHPEVARRHQKSMLMRDNKKASAAISAHLRPMRFYESDLSADARTHLTMALRQMFLQAVSTR